MNPDHPTISVIIPIPPTYNRATSDWSEWSRTARERFEAVKPVTGPWAHVSIWMAATFDYRGGFPHRVDDVLTAMVAAGVIESKKYVDVLWVRREPQEFWELARDIHGDHPNGGLWVQIQKANVPLHSCYRCRKATHKMTEER